MAAGGDSNRFLRSAGGARVAAICGVLWPVLSITRLFLTGEFDRPDWTDARGTIVAFYEGSSFDGQFMAGIGLVALAYLLLLAFVAKLSGLIGEHEHGAPWLGRSVLAFNVMGVVATIGYVVPFATAVFWASHGGLSDDGYLVLHGLSFAAYWVVLPADLLFGLALGGAILVTRLFPPWLGWAFVVTGLAEAATWFSTPEAWNATSGLPYVWMLAAGVMVLRRPAAYVSRATEGRPVSG